MNEVNSRIEALRLEMKKASADWYFATSDDYHGSEYVADFFKVREHYTGFTGENAFLIVGKEAAYMWTDGRFFIQAENELKGSGVCLMKMGEPGVPTLKGFIKDCVKEDEIFFFDGRMVTTSLGKEIEKIISSNGGKLVCDRDIAGDIWENRPKLPTSKIYSLSEDIVGESVSDKLLKLRKTMEGENAKYHFLGSLDDIAWITNLRGADIECNPVFLAYMFISDTDAFIFMQEEEISNEISEYLKKQGFEIKKYNEILSFLSQFEYKGSVLLDESSVNFACFKELSAKTKVINIMNPSKKLKACKNSVEISHLKNAYLKDSVCVTKFAYWLKNEVKKRKITEIDASDYLDSLRRKVPGFLDLSFPTISGYAENGAIVHYSATKESNATLRPEGMLLVDSGGQYLKGTTDVTRTISLGPVSEKMRLHYTKTAVGMLSLASARFLHGCTGRNLDILSRKPLWDLGIDFKHGTGHGVGYILNVHEGPQNIRWKYVDGMSEYPLEPGMITSDEPGVYIEGEYGIRIENIILCVNDKENEYGKFLKFEHLTFVPLDRDLLCKEFLTENEIQMVDDYQRAVFEKMSPFLDALEYEWLKNETRPL